MHTAAASNCQIRNKQFVKTVRKAYALEELMKKVVFEPGVKEVKERWMDVTLQCCQRWQRIETHKKRSSRR